MELEKAYPLIKSQWFDREEPVVAVAHNGSNPFYHISQETKTLFLNEHADYPKAIEMATEKGIAILVLLNFRKDESYCKVKALASEDQTTFKTILLFSDVEFY